MSYVVLTTKIHLQLMVVVIKHAEYLCFPRASKSGRSVIFPMPNLEPHNGRPTLTIPTT